MYEKVVTGWLLILSTTVINAQVKTRTLKKRWNWKWRTEDELFYQEIWQQCGLASHLEKYYAAMAGNLNYPLCVFDGVNDYRKMKRAP